jgi:hypothetical protein
VKIARVTTQGVRGLPDRTFELTDSSSGRPLDVVLVTGASGSGKTSFLDAIAAAKEDVAPYGPRRSPAALVRRGSAAAKIRIDWWLTDAERARLAVDKSVISSESILSPTIPPSTAHDPRLVTLLGAYDHRRETPKLEYFHEHRTLARGSTGSSALDPAEQRGLRLGKDLFKYAVLPRYLMELYLDGPAGAAEFEKGYAALNRGRKPGGLRKTHAGREVFFVAADGTEVGIEDLSASEQQAVIFAATVQLVGLAGSVLLVDAPEKHLESGAVVPFTFALLELAVDNQLIVATGSAELVRRAAPGSVITLGPAGS